VAVAQFEKRCRAWHDRQPIKEMKPSINQKALPVIFCQVILTGGFFAYLHFRQHGWPSPGLALLVYGCLMVMMILFVPKAHK
jgi:hypothetical protein